MAKLFSIIAVPVRESAVILKDAQDELTKWLSKCGRTTFMTLLTEVLKVRGSAKRPTLRLDN
jgi:hypothetical protein